MNLFFGAIVFATTVTSAFLLASMVELVMHRSVFTAIAGALGGALGQRAGCWIAGNWMESDGAWLSNLDYERIYRLHYIYSQCILFGAILVGSVLGFAINYYFQLWWTKVA